MRFPRFIEIQTTSACNSGCIICPHKDVSKEFLQGKMKDELFSKILEEVGGRKVRIIPYLNNEPFLDKKLISRLKLIRKKCRNAEIELSTNVSLITPAVVSALKKSRVRIDDFRCSVFGFTKETHEKMMPGLSWEKVKKNLDALSEDGELRKRINKLQLVMIDFPLVKEEDRIIARDYCRKNKIRFNLWGFMDRCRNVKSYSNKAGRKNISGCEQQRHMKRMHILFDGKVILCCNDWRQEYVLGDLNKDSIEDIWNSKRFSKVRGMIDNPKASAPRICQRCILAR